MECGVQTIGLKITSNRLVYVSELQYLTYHKRRVIAVYKNSLWFKYWLHNVNKSTQ